jgi:hypothetical protein
MRATSNVESIAPGEASPQIVIPDGTVEALKWLAVVLMTLDHVNKYLLGDALPWVFAIGRMAMPIFGFVLAYNLARPGALASGLYLRTLKRLLISGLVAAPFSMALGGLLAGWWPLNIMFTLAAATGVAHLADRGGAWRRCAAVALFVLGGSMVEFWWFAIVFILGVWRYFKIGSRGALIAACAALAALFLINNNLWALAAVPIMLAAPSVDLQVPRLRYFFYVYYPGHLAVLLTIAKLLGKHF